ncbi:Ff.00g068330.m01.CDS01 [Fusarium sp. VM40]|nr:Ff.00g068330.m01.CDS01 [Fusarium sp. VM40]
MAKRTVKTRFLVISDTHGSEDFRTPLDPADVAIHCGDLTQESKLDEFQETLRFLKQLDASLKLVIAGNHDFTLDTPVFERKIAEAGPLEQTLVDQEYGVFGQARRLLDDAADDGIVFLDEGVHHFDLANGAHLTVFASPYTPSTNDSAFQYHPYLNDYWDIDPLADIVITHGPPQGILDMSFSNERLGCPGLFQEIARRKPLMHCFGHVHEAWGAKLVQWRRATPDFPSHFTAIENQCSYVIDSLDRLGQSRFDSVATIEEKEERKREYERERVVRTRHCEGDEFPAVRGFHTLFVNAAVQGVEEDPAKYPWLVELQLPLAERDGNAST